jgi:hypothetical protein
MVFQYDTTSKLFHLAAHLLNVGWERMIACDRGVGVLDWVAIAQVLNGFLSLVLEGFGKNLVYRSPELLWVQYKNTDYSMCLGFWMG